MNAATQATLCNLLDALLDGELTPEQMQQLDDLVRTDAEARHYFVVHMSVVSELERQLPQMSAIATTAASSGRRTRIAKWSAAAAALLVAGVLIGYMLTDAGPSSLTSDASSGATITADRTSQSPPDPPPIAVLATGDRVQFGGNTTPDDKVFGVGEYRLAEGRVCLRFRNDVQLEVAAPAHFEIVSDMMVVLRKGKLRAHVSERARGFTIAVPEMEIEDLGTEFGVYVDEDKSTELHVFTGEVELHRPGKVSQLLREGSATVWRAGNPEGQRSLDNRAFPTRAEIGLSRWKECSKRLQSDPSAVFYFDFEPDAEHPQRLRNRAVNASGGDGTIHGALWVTGRWPDKGGLLFEREGDRVNVDVPGKYSAFTLSAWIQVTRLDFPIQVIFNTVEWERRKHHHWQIFRNGALHAGVQDSFDGTSPAGTISTGQWVHTAVVVDRDTRSAKYYVNGQLVLSPKWRGDAEFEFGPSMIGSWKPEHRGFRGRIDDLALFGRAFSVDEIVEITKAGSEFVSVPQTPVSWVGQNP